MAVGNMFQKNKNKMKKKYKKLPNKYKGKNYLMMAIIKGYIMNNGKRN